MTLFIKYAAPISNTLLSRKCPLTALESEVVDVLDSLLEPLGVVEGRERVSGVGERVLIGLDGVQLVEDVLE